MCVYSSHIGRGEGVWKEKKERERAREGERDQSWADPLLLLLAPCHSMPHLATASFHHLELFLLRPFPTLSQFIANSQMAYPSSFISFSCKISFLLPLPLSLPVPPFVPTLSLFLTLTQHVSGLWSRTRKWKWKSAPTFRMNWQWLNRATPPYLPLPYCRTASTNSAPLLYPPVPLWLRPLLSAVAAGQTVIVLLRHI